MSARFKAFLDLVVTLAIGVASVLLIWRVAVDQASGAPPAPSKPTIEDLRSAGLMTRIGSEARLGSSEAPLVIIEYSDFECPFCARYAAEIFPSIEQDFIAAGRVEYVFRNYPLERIHPSAVTAAHVAKCAHRQGYVVPMREFLFTHQQSLRAVKWTEAAVEMGLDRKMFESCISAQDTSDIRTEKEEGTRLGVNSTPTFLFGQRRNNGEVRIVGRLRGAPPPELFPEAVDLVMKP